MWKMLYTLWMSVLNSLDQAQGDAPEEHHRWKGQGLMGIWELETMPNVNAHQSFSWTMKT
jgi:hypothetical protein